MVVKGRPRDEAARERIVSAAGELFIRDGYVATTIGAIAEQAQVAIKTIYAAYGNKLGVLSAAHDRAVLGDGGPTPLLQHAWVRALADAESVEVAWAQAADRLAESTARAAPTMAAIHAAAADPGVTELLADLRRQRHAFSLGLARILLDLPGARPGVTGRVADVIYATMTAESYALFVIERGWRLDQWRDWAHSAVARELTTAPGLQPDLPTQRTR
ncbi:putative TetR family transcriptional regulator [Kineosphaera limosa NBRC 100340]|uniref:Putative TetR family transcriptional regulator n=1 Tax=Kineosphaera limosa NBRC 100340 TaxID=1184609 RepID=K6X079_9MICO|nr:putative TetR family transcriptional regulator [Kineosphaera limosa NBRC 100340]